jgi:CheY-like chemotaxis protein
MKRRILLADDSVTIQKVIELTFMDEDFEVRAVSNGDEALALLPEVKPDFVIADVHMPGANGYEVCRRSKQLRASVPVLLLVGTFEPFDENEARAAGADSFLKKPFDSQELLQRVQELTAPVAQAPAAAPPPAPSPVITERAALPTLEFPPLAEPAAPAFSPAPAAIPPAAVAPEAGNGSGQHLSDGDVDRIARRVVELLGDKTVRDVAWEVIPDLAEVIIRDRLRELESQVE